jgi:hypothetical protein
LRDAVGTFWARLALIPGDHFFSPPPLSSLKNRAKKGQYRRRVETVMSVANPRKSPVILCPERPRMLLAIGLFRCRRDYDGYVFDAGACRGAAMNRALILLLSGVLAIAWPGGAAAGGERAAAAAMAKMMLLFGWSASRFATPKRVVAPEKEWTIVQDAQTKRAARITRERQLREARQRIADRERELGLAREAYRHETSRILQAPHPMAGERVGAAERRTHEAQEARLQLAGRRVNQREREAYEAKLEYGRAARAVREQRRRDAGSADTDS